MIDEAPETPSRRYEIRLAGHLDERRVWRFEGFKATLLPNGETLLTGTIVDQAALHGILACIRDMGTPLIEVRQLPESPEEPQDEVRLAGS